MAENFAGILSLLFWLGFIWALLALLSLRWRLFGYLFRAYNRSLVFLFRAVVWIVRIPFKNWRVWRHWSHRRKIYRCWNCLQPIHPLLKIR